MKKISARSKLVAAVLIVVMIFSLSLTAFTYWQFNKVIETELIHSMASRTKESADHINTWLTGRLEEVRETVESPIIARVLALNPHLDLWRNDESIRLIDELNLARWKYVSTAYPDQYAALHIVNSLAPDKWGDPASLNKLAARYFNVKEGICKTHLWAKAAAAEAGQRYSRDGGAYDAIFKPAYSEAYEKDMVLIFAWRKNEHGKVVAGAAASLNMETIQGISQHLKYGQKGYGILLAQDGTFVTHPNREWAMKQKVTAVGDKSMQMLGELVIAGKAGIFRFTEGRENKIAFYNPVPIAQWAVVSVIDEDELFVPANRLRILMLMIMASIIVFTFLAAYIIALTVNKRRRHAAERRAYLAEIAALQAQIQPHFLYNTLNTIAALCRTDPQKAAEMLGDLSDYLQGKFRLNSMEMVPLEQELDLTKSYVAIEKVRFGERLNIVFHSDPDVNPHIPPLILQPLVENAVKHGIYPKREGGTVRVSVEKREAAIFIIVTDDGIGMSSEQIELLLSEKTGHNTGIGIRNINKRLLKYYGYGLDIKSEVNKGTIITVKIPHNRGDKHD